MLMLPHDKHKAQELVEAMVGSVAMSRRHQFLTENGWWVVDGKHDAAGVLRRKYKHGSRLLCTAAEECNETKAMYRTAWRILRARKIVGDTDNVVR